MTNMKRIKVRADLIYKILFPEKGIKNLEREISAEIFEDEFSSHISAIAGIEENQIFLEIGSSAGEGSTRNFVDAISARDSSQNCHLFCFEINRSRLNKLNNYIKDYSFVEIINMSSIALHEYPSSWKIFIFMLKRRREFRGYGILNAISWLRIEKEYLKRKVQNNEVSGIDYVLDRLNGELPDVVLIDGSEFTGEVELEKLWGSRFLLLDDILTYKNYLNFEKLMKSQDYVLLIENRIVRNGFAIFKNVKKG